MKKYKNTASNNFQPTAFQVGISKESFGEKTFIAFSQNVNRIEKL